MTTDPLLALPGAVAAAFGRSGAADGSDAIDGTRLAPAHFGAPLIEQRALANGDAVVSLSHRGVVTVEGQDRLAWLHSMTSQHLSALTQGESVETLLLDPQGHIEHAIRIVDDGTRAWLLVDEDESEALAGYLARMRFSMRVEVADVSEQFAVILAFEGGQAVPALRGTELAVAEWVDPWAEVARGGVQYARGEHAGAAWNAIQFVFRREDLPTVVALIASGKVSVAGIDALEALEVRAWRPSLHAEGDARAIPHEFDWLRTSVHLDKGCYRGQETVAKVHNLGHPPRRLVMLHLDGSEGQLPETGSLVFRADHDDRPVGRVTRAALHYEWGGIALALLKRATPVDVELRVSLGASGEFASAAQEVIVPPEAGSAREIPRLPRLPRV